MTVLTYPLFHYGICQWAGIHLSCSQGDSFEVWERPLSGNRLAVAVMNRQEIGGPRRFIISVATLPSWQLCDPKCNVTQILPVYQEMGVQNLFSKVMVQVNPTGTTLLTVSPGKSNPHDTLWHDLEGKTFQRNGKCIIALMWSSWTSCVFLPRLLNTAVEYIFQSAH